MAVDQVQEDEPSANENQTVNRRDTRVLFFSVVQEIIHLSLNGRAYLLWRIIDGLESQAKHPKYNI
jgi:hypothetical protein